MPSAYFEDEPDAEAAASVLQDLGFDAKVHNCTTETFAQVIAKFYRGEIKNNENNALLTSDDASADSFTSVVSRHGGRVVEQ